MKKWYLSTPINGKTEKEIQAALQRGIDWVKERGDEYHSPYEPLDECTGVAFIGDRTSLKSSKGCFIEYQIALEYGKEIRFID